MKVTKIIEAQYANAGPAMEQVSQEPSSLKPQYFMFPKLKAGRHLLQKRCNKLYNKYR